MSGRTKPVPGCIRGHQKGLVTPGTPCTPTPPLLQSVPVHWSNSPRGQGKAPETVVSTVLGTLPLSPLLKEGP